MALVEQNDWFQKSDVLRMVRMKTAWFDRDVKPRLPESAIRKDGRKLYLYLPDVISVLMDRQRERLEKATDKDIDEKIKQAKLERQLIDNERLKGTLVPVHDMDTTLVGIAAVWRETSDKLEAHYGAGARDLMNIGLDEIRRLSGVD